MKKAIFLALTIAVLSLSFAAWAQEKETKPSDETQVSKFIKLKYIGSDHLRVILGQLGFREEAHALREADGVVMIQGSESQVKTVEDIIQKFDVPQPPAKNIELTAYVLQTSPRIAEEAVLPPELNEVVTELKKVLNYKVFNLLSSLLIRARDGAVAGGAKGAAGSPPGAADLNLAFQRISIDPGEKTPTVRIEHLDFRIFQNEPRENIKGEPVKTLVANIETSFDVPVGQKVVVGKTSWGSPDNAIILVITAKIMD